MHRVIAAGLVALMGTSALLPGESARPEPEGWARVAAVFHDRAQKAGIVGSSLILVKDGAIAASAVDGYQDLDTRRVVDGETIYHWASITKTFTGIAIMQLRDRGRLSLDDSIVKYVPEFRRVHNPYGDISQVTIRHMMMHSSGLRAPTWPWGGDQPWHPFEPTEWSQLVAMLPYTQLNFAPGSKYSYSNPGVVFLGRIIEALSGDDYEIYVTKNILSPLGMHASFFDRAPYHLIAHRSHSYLRTDAGLTEARFDFDTGITVSNGGLNAPLADMARYLAFLTGASAPAGGDAVLRRASLEQMWTPQIAAADGEGATGPHAQAGLSFFIEQHGGVELIGHSGDQNGFISHLYLHRPTATGYVVSFNTDVAASKSLPSRPDTRQVDAAVRDAIIREILARK
uniref:Beta-lactamase n=1 Tax=uncultured bacterium 66 TaxID=698391 RepID=E3T670_9BACT|nr:beta-lactamase [uncultured bacterium 66]